MKSGQYVQGFKGRLPSQGGGGLDHLTKRGPDELERMARARAWKNRPKVEVELSDKALED